LRPEQASREQRRRVIGPSGSVDVLDATQLRRRPRPRHVDGDHAVLVRELGLVAVHLAEPGRRRRVRHQLPCALHEHLCRDAASIFLGLERLHGAGGVEHVGESDGRELDGPLMRDDAHGGNDEELVGEGLQREVDALVGAQQLQRPGLDRVHGELGDVLDADAWPRLAALPLDVGRRGARGQGHGELREALVPPRLGAPPAALAVEGADDAGEAVHVPDLEHGPAVVERVGEEAVARGQRVALAPEDGAVGERQAAEQREVVLPHRVADVDGPAGDGAGRGVEGGAGVRGLEHVPVRVDEVAHPQRVVGAVHHVAPLQPEGAVGVAGGVRAPEVVAHAAQRHRLRAQQHEVVAVLHARDHAVAAEVPPHRRRQPGEVGLGQLDTAAVLLAQHLQQLLRQAHTCYRR
jgi:hypothetical protein